MVYSDQNDMYAGVDSEKKIYDMISADTHLLHSSMTGVGIPLKIVFLNNYECIPCGPIFPET